MENKTFALASLQLGILSLVLSISLGVMMFAPLFIIASLIFGILALVRIKKDPRKYGGKIMAWIGMILSIISIAFLLYLFSGISTGFIT